jgi:hypothetical protein
MRTRVLASAALLFCVAAISWADCSSTPTQCAINSNGSLTTDSSDQGSATNSQTFTVSGMTAGSTVANIKITFNSWALNGDSNGDDAGDFYFELISPDGKAFDFLGEANDACVAQEGTVTISFADNQTTIPDGCTNYNYTFTNGATYAPFVSADATAGCADPSGSHSGVKCAAPYSNATFESAFAGAATNGTWTIYAYDPFSLDKGSISSLTLTITATASETSTTTSLSAGGVNQLFTTSPGNTTNLTATVHASDNSTVNEGVVTFLDDGSAIAGCSGIAVSGGSASCNSYGSSTEGLHALTASYSDTASSPKYAASDSSNSPVDIFVDNHTQVNGSTFCDNGTITLSPQGIGTATQPYPQHVYVTGLSGSLATVTLKLNNLTINGNNTFSGLDMLLVAPDGTSFVPLAEVGSDVSGSVSNLTFSIADNNPALSNGSVNGSSNPSNGGTYGPADYNPSLSFPNAGSSTLDSPPASGYNLPPSQGTDTMDATFASENLNNPSNPWSLYVTSDTGNYSATIGGYCLSFTEGTATASSTAVSVSSNPATIPSGQTTTNVTLKAHVTANGSPVTTGSVTFYSNGTQVGSAQTLDANGNASVPLSGISEGTYNIGADYSGVQAQFTASQGSTTLEVDQATVETANGNNSYSYCNPATITIPGSTVPLNYPSRVFVTNAPGTLLTLGVTVDAVTFTEHYLEMMLEGPGGAANNLVLWANIGSNPGTSLSNQNFTLEDDQTALPSSGGLSGGTYSPAAYSGTSNVIFPSPAPASNQWNYPTALGSSTFGSVFPKGTNPNGTYEFFVYHNVANTGSVGEHCVNFTVTPPVVVVTKTANGTFTQGDSSDTYTITVKNNGPGSTGGTLTLTDTLPSPSGAESVVSFTETGNTTVGGSGPFTDWNCVGTTCTRTTPMPSGETDTLTLTVAVTYSASTASNATTNTATLSGGGVDTTNSTLTGTSTITVKQGPGYPLNITVNPSGAGTVSASPTQSSGDAAGYYIPGTTVTLTATPTQNASIGYTFSGYTDTSNAADLISANQVTVNNNPENVTANFTVAYTNVTASTSVTSTGFIYNRAKKQDTATVTIKNTSTTATISGPVQLVISGLPAGVTGANNTGTFNGSPYWTATNGSLGPGASVQVSVVLNNANATNVSASYSVYSGNL